MLDLLSKSSFSGPVPNYYIQFEIKSLISLKIARLETCVDFISHYKIVRHDFEHEFGTNITGKDLELLKNFSIIFKLFV